MSDDLPDVIGALPALAAAGKLDELGDVVNADGIRMAAAGVEAMTYAALDWPWEKTPVHRYTAHAFGYLPPAPYATSRVDIEDAGNITADKKLRGKRIKVTLDRLRVQDYPGSGQHMILFDFYARHQTDTVDQDVRFNQVYRVQEGSGAGISGYPVFIGLKVGEEGVAFRCYTVNVENNDDQRILSFLDSDVFKKGLELLNTVNPVVPVVSEFATGITKAFANRNKNVPVQDFFLGLDFSGIGTRAQLRQGSYIAVQTPDLVWDWTPWQYAPSNGQIVGRDGGAMPFNYVVFSVSQMGG
ncbi:MAG: hypothetical protein AMXMBFR53_00030 [Gemmatimonadota bacterium]